MASTHDPSDHEHDDAHDEAHEQPADVHDSLRTPLWLPLVGLGLLLAGALWFLSVSNAPSAGDGGTDGDASAEAAAPAPTPAPAPAPH